MEPNFFAAERFARDRNVQLVQQAHEYRLGKQGGRTMNAAARGKMVRHMLIALVVASLISVAIATSSSAAFSVEKPARKLMATTSSGAETAAAIVAPANIMAIVNPAQYLLMAIAVPVNKHLLA